MYTRNVVILFKEKKHKHIKMLLFDIVYGIEYYIKLDKEYDYFDIIPDLEKCFRRHFKIAGDTITVLDYNATMKRYSKTTHYKLRIENRYITSPVNYGEYMQLSEEERLQRLKNKELLRRQHLSANLPIIPTSAELDFIDAVKIKLGDKYVDGYWDEIYSII